MKRSLVVLALVLGCDRSAPPPPPTPVAPPAAEASAPPSSAAIVDAAPPDPATRFEAVVGDWRDEEIAGVKGFAVDGTRWMNGTPSANLADQAKKLYGDRYAEFLDGVRAFAFFPLAIARDEPPAGDVKLSVRFYPVAGKIDQAAGIAFAIAPDGSYLGVRANALEDNVLFFEVVKGKRRILDTIRNVPTPSRTWHTLVVTIRGAKLEAQVDGTKRLDKTLDRPPVGRVGLWSKADSHVVFDAFEIGRP